MVLFQRSNWPVKARQVVKSMNSNRNSAVSGAWIFVSRSHRDLENARRIRNELERRGHNPLLFFLKRLENDDARLPELARGIVFNEDANCWPHVVDSRVNCAL